MIVSHLAELMGKHKVRNINQLSVKTGVSTPTLYRLYDGTNTRIDYTTLEALCHFFGCAIGDIIEYIPEEKGD